MENQLNDKKFRKWGWYILAAFVSMSISKSFPGTELKHSIIYLLGISFTILVYFFFRNKIFKNYNKYILPKYYTNFSMFKKEEEKLLKMLYAEYPDYNKIYHHINDYVKINYSQDISVN